MYCQGFVISGLSGFRSYSGNLGDEFNPLPQLYILIHCANHFFNVNSGNVDVFKYQSS